MPMKPGKDESQADFLHRCIPEMMGPDKEKRPQEQAVAACLSMYRQGQKAIFEDTLRKSDHILTVVVDKIRRD